MLQYDLQIDVVTFPALFICQIAALHSLLQVILAAVVLKPPGPLAQAPWAPGSAAGHTFPHPVVGPPADACQPTCTSITAQHGHVSPHSKILAIAAAHISYNTIRREALQERPDLGPDSKPCRGKMAGNGVIDRMDVNTLHCFGSCFRRCIFFCNCDTVTGGPGSLVSNS
jgi:hypothetical protein